MRMTAGVMALLAALALAGCDRPASGTADSGGGSQPAQAGKGLTGLGGSGLGMTGSFPAANTSTQALGAGAASHAGNR
jgi:hypothetical protein